MPPLTSADRERSIDTANNSEASRDEKALPEGIKVNVVAPAQRGTHIGWVEVENEDNG